MQKSILLITTGGTIASRETPDGLVPEMDAADLLAFAPALARHYQIHTLELMNLDSSNIQAEEWLIIARTIAAELPKYDGIVITHGTDTMAYTASALSFLLHNVKKPVVLTGSQMPIDAMLTDARNNLYTAFAAVEYGIAGISVAFDRHIIRGCRAVKVRTMGFEAFESINAPYLAEVFADGLHSYVPAAVPTDGPCVQLRDGLCNEVFLLKLIPGTNPRVFDMICAMGYRGVVIETFGAGGMHFLRRNLLENLARLTGRGVAVVACSQCLYGASNLSIYEVGTRLLECGVIAANDMTTEAAVTKLMWALGQTQDPEEIKRIFFTNYCGEITL